MFLFSPHYHQHLLFLISLMIDVLTGVKQYLFVVLLFISLMISEVENIFICLLAIIMSSLEKLAIQIFFLYFLSCWVRGFLMLSLWVLYIFWILMSYQVYHLQLSSPIHRWHFYLVCAFLFCCFCSFRHCEKLFSFILSHFFIFFICLPCLRS